MLWTSYGKLSLEEGHAVNSQLWLITVKDGKQLDKTRARTYRVVLGGLDQAASSLLPPGLDGTSLLPPRSGCDSTSGWNQPENS